MLEKIYLVQPRGFCAGVNRAVQTVEMALVKYGRPLYVRHHIVHNEHVVRDLEKQGVIFVENLAEIPNGERVIFSAHGVTPEVRIEAEKRQLNIIDATCPLVLKVHQEAKKYYQQGFKIILIGHRGHQEVIGIMGEAPMQLISTINDVENLQIAFTDKMICLTQTTLSLDDTAEIIKKLKQKFPQLKTPLVQDICYATQNRQDAVKKLSAHCDLVLVIGSEQSSNSKRLAVTVQKNNGQSYLIADELAINKDWLVGIKTLGITAGASVPEYLVTQVLQKIKQIFPEVQILELQIAKEQMRFSLPIDL